MTYSPIPEVRCGDIGSPASFLAATEGFRPQDLGCGEPIETIEALFRCVQCAVAFHRECARRHFDWPEAGGSLMPHALDAALAAAAEAEAGKRLPDWMRRNHEAVQVPIRDAKP